MQENNLISIQEVSNLLKVPKPTLRFWEKELDGILAPLRTNGGQRRYTVENIAVIEEIQKLKSKGMSLPEIKRKFSNSHKGGNPNSNNVDLLAERVAEIVKVEVNRFFEGENDTNE
ncbi:MerR family transcriptional regulator [candidate division WOR-3 bacterium]|nr:MerR family transcriptional regulator [candidate division WOR-3 bacterium]